MTRPESPRQRPQSQLRPSSPILLLFALVVAACASDGGTSDAPPGDTPVAADTVRDGASADAPRSDAGAADVVSAADVPSDAGVGDAPPSDAPSSDAPAPDAPDGSAADAADAGDGGPEGGPFVPIAAVTACAPEGDACALGAAAAPAPVHASYRKDHFFPHEVHPEELLDEPLDGGRFHVAAIAAASGAVTEIRLDGQDVEDMLVEPLLEWYHVWPDPLVAGEPVWFAFHSRNPAWDEATSGHLTIRTADGDAVDADFPVAQASVPITYVTTSEDRSTLLVHVRNEDDVPHTLTGLLVNGRDVLAADVACVPDRTVPPGHAALWTVPSCEPWPLGAAWTVVATFADAPPSVGVGRVLKPHFPIEAWPRSADCPLPGLDNGNFAFYRDGGIDTLYMYWGAGERCGFDRDEMYTETLPAIGDVYLLLGDDFPWQDPPPERMADTSAILGFLTGDESDWAYYDDDGDPKAMAKARKSAALWRLYPELLTYNGAMTNKHIGVFAGMADVQGIDIYNAGCAPTLFVPPDRPDLRTPYDYLRNARNNHMPQPTWLYSQGLSGWSATVTAQEIENQAVSVGAAGGKGLMWFQVVRGLAEDQPETWGAMVEMNRMYRGVRSYLREGDITGMAHTDAEAIVELVRARDALVVFVLSIAADNDIQVEDCIGFQLGVREEPHWQFSDQAADVSLTIPADFAARDIFEIDGAAIHELAWPVHIEGRTLTLLDVPLGMDAVTRVFVIAAAEDVRARVAAGLNEVTPATDATAR